MVVLSAVEAEIAAQYYMNARELLQLCVTCAKLGHHQSVTPMRTDTNTASRFINSTFKKKQETSQFKIYILGARNQQLSRLLFKTTFSKTS